MIVRVSHLTTRANEMSFTWLGFVARLLYRVRHRYHASGCAYKQATSDYKGEPSPERTHVGPTGSSAHRGGIRWLRQVLDLLAGLPPSWLQHIGTYAYSHAYHR